MKTSSFNSDVLDKLKIGAKVEVAGGYGSSLVVLFVGLLNHVRVSYGEGGVTIQVSAYDSTILLRNAKKFALYENEDKNALIKKILQGCAKDGLATISDSNIGNFGGEKVRLEQAGLDDCEFITTTLARRERFSFAIIHGQVVLKNLVDEQKAIMKLTYGKNIFSFDIELDTTKQVGKVVARSIHDVNRTGVEGSASSVSIKKSGGKAAIDFSSLKSKISSNVIEYKDPLENTKEGLDKIAQAVMDERAMTFVSGHGMCIGLPELVPGRYIELDGMGKQINGTYFITKVTHRFGQDGFTTQFDVKGAYSNGNHRRTDAAKPGQHDGHRAEEGHRAGEGDEYPGPGQEKPRPLPGNHDGHRHRRDKLGLGHELYGRKGQRRGLLPERGRPCAPGLPRRGRAQPGGSGQRVER